VIGTPSKLSVTRKTLTGNLEKQDRF
jgi:hypothetical protein